MKSKNIKPYKLIKHSDKRYLSLRLLDFKKHSYDSYPGRINPLVHIDKTEAKKED